MNENIPSIPCIYAIRHVSTGKVYIGKTKNLNVRFNRHLNALKNGSHVVENFQHDFDNLGEDIEVFVLCRLNECVPSELCNEKIWFSIFKSNDSEYGYNYKEKFREPKLEDFENVSVNTSNPKKRSAINLTGRTCKYGKLKSYLMQNGISISELSRGIGMDEQALRRRINSQSKFNIDDVMKIVRFLNCKPNDIFEE